MPPHPVMTLPETMEVTPVQNQELFTQALFICKVWMIFISNSVMSCLGKYIHSVHMCPRSSEDPWSSSGYSAMLGHSPHISQAGTFSAINPQDRMVCRKYCHICVLITVWWKFSIYSSVKHIYEEGKFVWLSHFCSDRIILFTAAKWMDSTQPPLLTITHLPSTEMASWVGCLRKWRHNTADMFT